MRTKSFFFFSLSRKTIVWNFKSVVHYPPTQGIRLPRERKRREKPKKKKRKENTQPLASILKYPLSFSFFLEDQQHPRVHPRVEGRIFVWTKYLLSASPSKADVRKKRDNTEKEGEKATRQRRWFQKDSPDREFVRIRCTPWIPSRDQSIHPRIIPVATYDPRIALEEELRLSSGNRRVCEI